MKSKPNPASLLKVLLSVAAGIAIGWWGKGMVTGRGSGSRGMVPATAEISRTGSGSAAPLTPQSTAGVNAEEPKALARRLLQEVFEGTQEEGSEELLKFRFQQALAGCDEGAVAEIVETLTDYLNGSSAPKFAHSELSARFSQLLVMRMVTLNARKALDFQIGLAQAQVRVDPSVLSLTMELLAEQDPAQIQKVIESLPSGTVRASVEIAWLQARTRNDPEGVFQYLMNLDEDAVANVSKKSNEISHLLQTLATHKPEMALQAITRFRLGEGYPLHDDLLRGWINRDPNSAANWLIEQNDAALFSVWLRSDESKRGGLDEKFLRDKFSAIKSKNPFYRYLLAENLASNLARQDIPTSLRWVATLPKNEQIAANQAVANAWIEKDVVAASKWLANWPAGQSKDSVLLNLVDAMLNKDPGAALNWAQSIQSADRYARMLTAIGFLRTKDPAAEKRAFQALPEEDRAVLSVMARTAKEFR